MRFGRLDGCVEQTEHEKTGKSHERRLKSLHRKTNFKHFNITS